MNHQRTFPWITAFVLATLTFACSEDEPTAQLPVFERPACLLLSEEERYGNQNQLEERLTYQYDEQGRVKQQIADDADNTELDTTIFHFEQGRWTGSTHIQNGSSDFYIRTLKLQNTYENNRLVRQDYRKEGIDTIFFRAVYQYDASTGYVNRFESYNADENGVLKLYRYALYTRTNEGNIAQEKEYEINPNTESEELEYHVTRTYEYDDRPVPLDSRQLVADGVFESVNNVVSERGEYADGRTYEKTFEYTYNEQGFPLTVEEYSTGSGEPSSTITYTYDCQ